MTKPVLDPLPGDFDAELADIDPRDVRVVSASRDRRLILQLTLEGEDAAALQRMAENQGQQPGTVIRSLIRAASEPAG